MSVSKAVIMGSVVRDPEKRFTSNNIPVTTFAINISQKPEEESLLRVVAKGKLAETSADNVTRGSVVVVDGKLQSFVMKSADGTDKKSMEIDARAIEVMGSPQIANSQTSTFDNSESFDFGNEISNDDLIGEDEIPF